MSYDDKIRFAQAAFGPVVTKSPARTIIELAKQLEHEGYSDLTVVVGSDRIGEFETLLNKYNGKEYHFTSISVVSAGERDPDAEGVSGMSASKMRAAASANDYTKFKSGAPSRLSEKETKEMFDKVREGMGIAEGVELEEGVHANVASYSTKDSMGNPRTYLIRKNTDTGEHKAILTGSNGIRHSHASVFGGSDKQASEHGANLASIASKGKHTDTVAYLNKHTGLKWVQKSVNEGSENDEEFGEFGLSDDELTAAFASLDYDDVVQAADSEHLVVDEEDEIEDDFEAGLETDEDDAKDVYPTCPGCHNELCPDCNPEGKDADELKRELDLEKNVENGAQIGEAVLTFQQRLQRARSLRARMPKLKRLRAVAAQRFAPGKQLMRRARHAAMAIIRKKVAGQRGTHYSNLSPSEKMAIDRQIQTKMKSVGAIAKRLLPMVRKKEQARLAASRNKEQNTYQAQVRHESVALKVVYEAKAAIAAKSDDSDNGEADSHIIMLLRKSVSLRGLKDVKFNDGNTVRVPAGEAQAALNLFNAAKTSIEKGAVQKKLAASYDSLKKAIGV